MPEGVGSGRRLSGGYAALVKPELTLLSACTAVVAAYLASKPPISLTHLAVTLVGTALVGGGAGALNQLLERIPDGLMKRTERRPIPCGRIAPRVALAIGLLLTIGGLFLLFLLGNLLAAGIALATSLLYLLVYTPLKRRTPLATVIGGIPGALPPLIGWATVRNEITPEAWSLFAILFFWQMPHFLALSWMYRNDYGRAGFRMLAVTDPTGITVRRQALVYALLLVPAAVMPGFVGLLGTLFLAGAGAASVVFLILVYGFARNMTNQKARSAFLGSVVYLPAILLLMIIDKVLREL